MTRRALVAWFVTVGCAAPLAAQDAKPPEDPAHAELRALRKNLVEAINGNHLDQLLDLLDEDVVVTFMNAEVGRKPAGVKAYYERMMNGPNKIVQSITIDPTVDELTHLYGNTGVAFGSSKDHFKLTDGRDFVSETRWTGTLVKKDGKWKVASFHASANAFDNPILWIAVKKTAMWAGIAAGLVGLVLGWAIGRRRTARA
jgi:ketosteroid isomerase-like protein